MRDWRCVGCGGFFCSGDTVLGGAFLCEPCCARRTSDIRDIEGFLDGATTPGVALVALARCVLSMEREREGHGK